MSRSPAMARAGKALAMMDHPNIAKVFDAGTTESGRPYFVMELVKGVPITQFCDEHHLTPRERLERDMEIPGIILFEEEPEVVYGDVVR